MIRKSMFAVALTVVIGLAADLALAHGGTYTGPAGGGTPTYGGPSGGGTTPGGSGGTTPGGGGGGGTTPGGGGGGGGTTPGGSGGPTRPPGLGAPGKPGGPAGRGTTPNAKSKDAGDRTHDWDYWWELNDDRFLNLKAKLRSGQQQTSNKDVDLGNEGGANAPVTSDVIANAIAPTLELALKDGFFDARAAAAVALGKITKATQSERIAKIIPLLKDSNNQVQESACLGLGLTGNSAQIPMLLEIMKNTPKGRTACGTGTNDIQVRSRAFAAMAIGLIGSRESVDESVVKELVEAMVTGKANKDLQVGPAIALGIMRNPSAAPKLQEMVRNQEPDADEIVRAQAAIALGKLGDKSSVKLLVEALGDRKAHVQRSAAIALGMLTDKADDATVAKLVEYAHSASDRAVRNFCIIAIGQIGNIKGRDFLVQTLKKGHGHDQTFAAIALGVYGFPQERAGERAEIGAQVLEEWNSTKSDSERGAYAISLGLLDYRPAAKSLAEVLGTGGSPNLKGYLCTALGLMGYREATPLIQAEVKQSKDLDVQRRASVALGLIQDPEAIKILQEVIKGAADNLSALGGAAVALGFIGDRQAVDTLTKIVQNTTEKDNARAFATVALGILGDKDSLSALTLIQMNSNYLAATPALQEVLTIY